MSKRSKGGYTVSYNDDLKPTVEFFPSREIITGRKAQNYVNKRRNQMRLAYLVLSPFVAIWWVVWGIHNGIEWLYDKIAGER